MTTCRSLRDGLAKVNIYPRQHLFPLSPIVAFPRPSAVGFYRPHDCRLHIRIIHSQHLNPHFSPTLITLHIICSAYYPMAAKHVGPYYTRIVRKLTDALAPTRLVLKDESAMHAGHAGNPGGGETHFALEIASERFRGLKQLERHRMVYAALKDELEEQVHALSLKTTTP